MATGQLAAVLGVSALVIVTPGPDTALTIRNALRGGIATAGGVASGQATWALSQPAAPPPCSAPHSRRSSPSASPALATSSIWA
jgi:hypothetical protein